MTIPPPYESEKFLYEMKMLYDDISAENINNVKMNILSMGMSNDYETAIKYGSTLVRIGTGLFGNRIYK